MLFNSYPFLIFALAVLAACRALPAAKRVPLLLGASLLFYAMWVPQYLILLLVEIVVNYVLVRTMPRVRFPGWILAVAVVFSLGLLAYYKYAAFLIESVAPFLGSTTYPGFDPSKIVLPLGISFYTFQILSVSIDTYRGASEPIRSFRDYALFVCFFPQLIAGPILRGSQLFPQIREGGSPTSERTRRGLWLVASGLVKKVLLADALLAPYVNRIFDAPGFASAPEQLIGVYSFAFQIYCDFSGYTDIARGVALMLGFELPMNFREPYLSRNPAEFWRRWHITLSSWLRDYLYVPLGGNRAGRKRTLLNLMLTMLLGGLWHGAAWNFVVWGGLHGLLLVAHRAWRRGTRSTDRPLRWRDAPRIVLLFHAVCVLWIFFRAAGFDDGVAILTRIVSGSWAATWPVMQTLVVLACAVLHGVERLARLQLARVRDALAAPGWGALEGAGLGLVAALVILFGGTGGEFIYFQF